MSYSRDHMIKHELKEDSIWKIPDLYMSTGNRLVQHHINSYENFMSDTIIRKLNEKENFIYLRRTNDKSIKDKFIFSNVIISEPSYPFNPKALMTPTDARTRNMTYASTIYADVKQVREIEDLDTGISVTNEIGEEKKVPIAKIPTMVKSRFCVCSNPKIKDSIKECVYDKGGYYIVNGNEKLIISQESMVSNKILILLKKDPNSTIVTAEIRSVSLEKSGLAQVFVVKFKKNSYLTISASQFQDEVPAFMILKALGLENDKEIANNIIYDDTDDEMLNLIGLSYEMCITKVNKKDKSCKRETTRILTKNDAISELSEYMKRKFYGSDEDRNRKHKITYMNHFIKHELLPHMGTSPHDKAMFICFMINKVLSAYLGRIPIDDRDSYVNKRIETDGPLFAQIFGQSLKKLMKDCKKNFKKKIGKNENKVSLIINQIKYNIVEKDLITALATGSWGVNHSKSRKGVAQVLKRLTYVDYLSGLRRIKSPTGDLQSANRLVPPRMLHNTQYGYLCVTGDTEILLSSGEIKKIADIVNESVITVNDKNLSEKESTIKNYIELLPDKLLKITTISNRVIKCTYDHPLLVKENNKYCWEKAGDLKENDLLIIRHTKKLIESDEPVIIKTQYEDYVLVNDTHDTELERMGLINCELDNKVKLAVARLFGIALVKCHFLKGKYIITFNNMDDALKLSDDIHCIGFKRHYVQYKQHIGDNYSIECDELLTRLITHLLKSKLPKWLMNADNNFKREFLSAFLSPNIESEIYDKKSMNLSLCNYVCYNDKYVSSSHLLFLFENPPELMSQIAKLFQSLGIYTHTESIYIQNGGIKTVLKLNSNRYNVNRFNDYIYYVYNSSKQAKINLLIEFLRCDMSHDYDRFIKYKCENNKVAIPIKTIEIIDGETVYDFETKSDNHSFIANSIVSHNCPIETPEGQPVGLVKHMSMLCTVTTLQLMQVDIIKELIKDDIIPLHEVPYYNVKRYYKVFLNGRWIGVAKDGGSVYRKLREARFNSEIDKMTGLVLYWFTKELKINTEAGRVIRPLFVVNDEGKLNITNEQAKRIKIYNSSDEYEEASNKNGNYITTWEQFMYEFPHTVEFIDVEESLTLMIARNEDDLIVNNKRKNNSYDSNIDTQFELDRYTNAVYKKFTHMEIHPSLLLGVVASTIPFSDHNPSPRNTYQCAQAKQALGIPYSDYRVRLPTLGYILHYPQKPLVITRAMRYIHSKELPAGHNVIVAIACYTGYNQEDSIIMNKSAIERGLFGSTFYRTYSSIKKKSTTTSAMDEFRKPDPNLVSGMRHSNYDLLTPEGIVPEETPVSGDDIIIGKITPKLSYGSDKSFTDSSVALRYNEEGIIDKVVKDITNQEDYEMIKIRVRSKRTPIIGDKFCVTEDHQILTNVGWLNVKELTVDHKVASLKDSKLVYVNPIRVYNYDHDDQIYCVKGDGLSLKTTMNHKMYVSNDKKDYELIEAVKLVGKKVYYKKDCINDTPDYTYHVIPSYKEHFERLMATDDLIKLYGIYWNCGNVQKIDNENTIRITGERFEDIVPILEAYNIDIKCDKKYFYITSDNIVNTFTDRLPCWFQLLSSRQSKLFIDYIFGKSTEYKCSSTVLADDIQILALNAGVSVDIDGTIINISESYPDSTTETIENYKGKVYCCEVPDHLIYVRHGGKAVWTGNSSRSGQKGTVGITLSQEDMPFTKDGIVPDIILNPHALPSRMTVGQIIEALFGKASAIGGYESDGTPFVEYDIEQVKDELESFGYERNGLEYMTSGITGKRMKSMIFICPTYYQRLKHMVLDKVHSRARGPTQNLTRQPVEGRARDGGLRIGEMERDCLLGYGVSQLLKEKLMDSSDKYEVFVCDICGLFARKIKNKNAYMCDVCDNKYRISKVEVPYALKLMFQELMSMKIAPRIKTVQNIYNSSD